MSVMNFLSYIASLSTSQTTKYSVSMVESTMRNWLILLQTVALPPSVNNDPNVDLRKSLLA